jgi:molybdate transport system substrate-binding protein
MLEPMPGFVPNLCRATLRSLVGIVFACVVMPAHADDLLLFAAASLRPTLSELLASPQAPTGVRASYAASSQLARQIEAGAPAAIFISADQDWMDELAQRGLVASGSRLDLLGNALVLVAPRDSPLQLAIAPGFDLAGALGVDGHLAMAQPDSVPAGRYAKAALVSLGVWDAVEGRIVSAVDVRAALNFVGQGEAPLGIVYRSDATLEPAVRVLGTFPESTHPPIVYPAAVVTGHDTPAARALLAWLRAPRQQAIFRSHGFDAPAPLHAPPAD